MLQLVRFIRESYNRVVDLIHQENEMRVNDLIGQQFHRLTVVSRVPDKRRGTARWLCKCICGEEKEADGIDLKAGKVKSCGCIRKDDLGDRRFGRLVALRPGPCSRTYQSQWYCICDCGNETLVRTTSLNNGRTQSCGCLFRDTHGIPTHGHTVGQKPTTIYQIWSSMNKRCNDLGDPDYGGRGIKVCDRWKTFETFLQDMGEHPGEGMSIDRIDVNGDYCPENCRWATKTEQSRNRRDTVYLTKDGVTRPMAEWAEILDMKYMTIHRRLRRGWSDEEALRPANRSVRKNNRYLTCRGETLTIPEWSEKTGIPRKIITTRLCLGMTEEAAVTTPYKRRQATVNTPPVKSYDTVSPVASVIVLA